jgi:tetratricopeptide (TPR) repeat protein
MYSSLPLNFEQLKLSERDARTIRKLYASNLAAVNDASAASPAVNLGDSASIKEAADLSLFNERATVAMNSQNYDEAVLVLQQGLIKFPQSSVLKRNLAAALNNTGLKALNAHDFDKALSTFEQALALNPASVPARNNIAIVHYNKGLDASNKNDMSMAESELKIAVDQLNGSNNQALLNKAANNYAFVLTKMGREAEAKAIKAKYKVAGI